MSRSKLVVLVILVAVVGVVAWRVMAQKSAGEGAAAMRAKADAAPVPVTAVEVQTRDVPVFLTALGTVSALNTVTISAQVSGQLKAVHFTEGGQVKKGDLIAEIDSRTYQASLEQALAKKKQDSALLASARSTLKRFEDLIEKKFVSAQDLENQRQSVIQQEALLASDDAAISNARTQLGYTRIVAPIDGLAGIRQVDVGNLVQANGGAIVVLTQVQPVNVIFTLPQQDMSKVREADAAPLTVQAMSRTDSTPLASGELKVIDNSIDSTTATFKLKAEFANDDRKLWPGEFVNVRLKVRTVAGGLVVPGPAVSQGPDGEFAWLVTDGKVSMQPVKTAGQAEDGGVVISEGLKAGDKVVTEGQFRLKADLAVKAMAPGEVAEAVAPPSDGEGRGKGRGRRPR